MQRSRSVGAFVMLRSYSFFLLDMDEVTKNATDLIVLIIFYSGDEMFYDKLFFTFKQSV